MDMNSCIAVANDIADTDRDQLLERVDALIASGIPPERAQLMAATDMLAEVEAEMAELASLVEEQHPDLFSKRQEPQESAYFGADDEEMRASTRSGRFQLRKFGAGAALIEKMQDRYNRWKQAVEDIRKQGGTVSDDNDFYLAEERYWGKVGAKIEDFKEEVEAFIKDVIDDGLTLGDVALYAYAEHAKDRNAYIASIRPTMPDGGSGMTNDEADAYLDDARNAGLDQKLAKHSATLRQWIQGTRDEMLANGLITQEQYDSWTLGMPSYVPLRGMPEQLEAMGLPSFGQGTGRGFDIRGQESKVMKGRKSMAKNIIENIIGDRTRTYIRSGKNEVGRTFLKFVLDNPSPNLWEIEAVENKPVIKTDPLTGDKVVEEQPRVVSDERTITVKDGGREIHILVKDAKLREQLKNLNADEIGNGIAALLYVNRILSRLYTALSPVFMVINGVRDVTSGLFGAIDELGFIGAGRMVKNLPAAFMEAARAERGQMSPDYQLYRSTGGKTGFFDFKTIDDLSIELMDMARKAEMGMLDPRKLGPKMLDVIESMNAAIENTTRLAVFKAAREEGRSVVDAARIAKNITVNFNRKGTSTPLASSFFLFFNPAVQGTTRMLQALANPKVQATLGAAMAGVFMLALRNASMGEDDDGVPWWDKIPNETKERNLIIVLPPGVTAGEEVPGTKEGRYIKLPMPYGYNFFAVVANQMADVWRNSQDASKGREAWEAFKLSAGAFMGSWVPVAEIGGSFENEKALALVAVPDAINPIIQNTLNVNPFGRPLAPEDRASENLPDSSKYFVGQAGSLYQKAAEGLNRLAGGNRVEPPPGPLSLLDLSPGALENLVRSYGGGPATFVTDIANAFYTRLALERPEFDPKRLPFAKQLYGVVNDETDRMIAYSRMEKAQVIVDRFNAARRSGDTEAMDEVAKDAGPILAIGGKLDATRERLSQFRKQELRIVSDEELSDGEKVARLMALNKDRRAVLQSFNAAYNEVLVDLRRQEDARP